MKSMINPQISLIAKAFHTDPLLNHIIPDSSIREKKIYAIYEYLTSLTESSGTIFSTENGNGIALVFDSTSPYDSFTKQVATGLLKAVCALGVVAAGRALRYDAFAAAIHKNVMPERHIYLHTIAVHPEHQQRGHGFSLVNEVKELATQSGLPVYLETSNPDNIALYQKWGFEVSGEFLIPGSDVSLWTMRMESERGESSPLNS